MLTGDHFTLQSKVYLIKHSGVFFINVFKILEILWQIAFLR